MMYVVFAYYRATGVVKVYGTHLTLREAMRMQNLLRSNGVSARSLGTSMAHHELVVWELGNSWNEFQLGQEGKMA